MNRLGTYLQLLLVLILAPAMAVSCTERLSDQVIVSGSKANVEMTLNAETKIVSLSGDRIINNLTLIVFNNKGERVNIESFSYNNAPIRLNTVSGSNSRIVTIANVDKDLAQKVQDATSYAQLSQLVVVASDSVATRGDFLMVGDSIIDIRPGNNAITIPLHFVCAKVSIKIENQLTGGESFIVNSCKLVDIPVSSYLFERPSDINDKYAERYVDWDSEGSATNIEFFMLENRRGIRTPQAGEKESDQHLNKRRFAPSASSYIIVNATHRTASGTASFDMYLYFGQNNATDYNVKRSELHNYTIRVKGFNNISVDSNIEYSDNNFDVVYGNLNFDAHPDSRQLLLKNGNGNIKVEVRDQNGRIFSDAGFSASWVKISPLDLMRHQIRQKGNGANSRWQQSGTAGHYVRGKYIPHKDVRATLGGGWNEIDIDDDNVMSYQSSTYRMCYEITDIVADGTTSNEIFIYLDDNTGGGERRAQIAMSCTDNNGETKTQLVTIYQQGAVYVGTFNGRKLYIESGQESDMNLYPDGLPFLSTHATMQWGFGSSLLYDGSDKFSNGAFMTASAVYGPGESTWAANDSRFVEQDGNGNPIFGTQAYRPKYAAGLNGFSNVTEPYDSKKLGTSGAPYHYPEPQYWTVTYHPIYGSSAAIYCHEKNRDKNGDGVIDDSESEWYLPSFDELEHIWVAQNGIKAEHQMESDQMYWTSSEYNASKVFAISMVNGCAYEPLSKTGQGYVRCVRRGQKADSPVELGTDGSSIVNNGDMPSGATTATSKGAAATTASMNTTIYRRLAVAKQDIKDATWSEAMDYSSKYDHTIANNAAPDNIGNGCAAYYEYTDKSDAGSWRVPTSRELMRIYILRNELASKSAQFTPLANTTYWSSSEDKNWSAWSVDISPQSAPERLTPDASSRNSKYAVRCVRELH